MDPNETLKKLREIHRPARGDGGVGVNDDPLRCRYHDCTEGHPVAIDEDDEDYHPSMGPSEQVTCPTCRKWLGLPPIERKDHD